MEHRPGLKTLSFNRLRGKGTKTATREEAAGEAAKAARPGGYRIARASSAAGRSEERMTKEMVSSSAPWAAEIMLTP